MARKLRITRRMTDVKKHTTGFVLTGGREVTRHQAVQMANRGQISGVRVIKSASGPYLQSTSNRNLYDLPITQASKTRRSRR